MEKFFLENCTYYIWKNYHPRKALILLKYSATYISVIYIYMYTYIYNFPVVGEIYFKCIFFNTHIIFIYISWEVINEAVCFFLEQSSTRTNSKALFCELNLFLKRQNTKCWYSNVRIKTFSNHFAFVFHFLICIFLTTFFT